MLTSAAETVQSLQINKSVQIAAPVETAFAALLEQVGPRSEMPDGKPFPMKLEAWPGGRWYRDLGGNSLCSLRLIFLAKDIRLRTSHRARGEWRFASRFQDCPR